MESKSLTSSSARRGRLIAAASLAGAAFVLGAVPSLASAGAQHPRIMSAAAARQAAKQDPNRGTLNTAARRALHRGYLVPNEAQYRRQKARAAKRAQASQALSAPLSPLAPSIVPGKSFQGINQTTAAPPDETGAVGTTRFIELVNSKFATYNKTSNTPIGTGTLNSLVGASSIDDVFDPQIIWDPTTKRFYYAADQVVSDTDNKIAFGFSKTASPTTAADWCKYVVSTGSIFYDYPKLGDSQFFAMIGSNRFNGSGSFVGADLMAISKPPAGTTCPSPASFKFGEQTTLKMSSTNPAFTPVPANEIDANATGWTVSRSGTLPATKLGLFKVTKGATGNPVIQATATPVTVPSYTAPANAPQQGSVNKIDTNDSRPTQAVAAVDPGRGKFAIWTQHTASGGAGAEVRWYEINPATHATLQKGKATSGALYEFNGAISPNRQVNGGTKSGGNAMMMNYNTSSSAAKPGIRMVSKIGGGAQSAPVTVKNSPGQLSGFDCSKVAVTGSCRWGDYASVTPDPSTANRLWNVSQFAVGSGSGTTGLATSRTWIFAAKP